MTKLNQDFTMYQGETKVVTINVDDDAGDPKVLTGGSGEFRASRHEDDPKDQTVLVKSGADVTLVSLDGTDDGIRFTIEPKDSARMQGAYNYEVRAIDNTSQEAIVTKGLMTVEPSLSRR